MFGTLYSRSILCSLRDRQMFVWILAFPIMLSTLFYFTFSSLDDAENLTAIPTAVVRDSAYDREAALSAAVEAVSGEDEALLSVRFVDDEAEADALLKAGEVDGYIRVADGRPQLAVHEDGVHQTILKSFLDQFLQVQSSVETILRERPEAIGDIASLIRSEPVLEEVSLSERPPTDKVNYFYALLAMVCLYGGFQGLELVSRLQANLSAQGARRTLSPVRRWKLVTADLLAGVTVQCVAVVAVIFYIRLVLGIDFGPQLLPVLLTGVVGSLTGVAFGAMVAVTNRLAMMAKSAVLISVTMVCCFLSGLMVGGINYMVMEHAPVVAWLNPAARITDAFYCLYYYDTYERFFLNIGILLLMAAAMFGVATLSVRRQQYESI